MKKYKLPYHKGWEFLIYLGTILLLSLALLKGMINIAEYVIAGVLMHFYYWHRTKYCNDQYQRLYFYRVVVTYGNNEPDKLIFGQQLIPADEHAIDFLIDEVVKVEKVHPDKVTIVTLNRI